MNTQIAPELTVLAPPSPQTAPLAAPANDPSLSTINQKPATNGLHRKIAKLPKPLRDLINSMLDDGASAREIIARLQASSDPPLPYPISEVNLSDWRTTGYQRHLAQQDRMASLQADREAALDMVAADDTTTLPEATLQIIASQYFQFLGDFSPESLKHKLAEDPLKYTRFLNVFARLVREIVHLKKHRQDCARAAAAQLKELDPDRDLVSEELRLLMDKMDRTFKVARPGLARHSLSASPPLQPAPPPPSPQTPEPAALAVLNPERGSATDEAPAPHCRRRGNESLTVRDSSGGNTQPPNDLQPASSDLQPHSHSLPTPNSQLSTLNSPPPPPELCPKCDRELPPLKLNGRRPDSHCWSCGAFLLDPNTELCPGCRHQLPQLRADGTRPFASCRRCGFDLPQPGKNPVVFTSYRSATRPP
jgi:hypothetical protein